MYILCFFGPHVLSLLTHLLNYEARHDVDGEFSMHFVDVFLIELYLYIGSGWCSCSSVWDHSIVLFTFPPPRYLYVLHCVSHTHCLQKTKHDFAFSFEK